MGVYNGCHAMTRLPLEPKAARCASCGEPLTAAQITWSNRPRLNESLDLEDYVQRSTLPTPICPACAPKKSRV
jgi:hypothetical protein